MRNDATGKYCQFSPADHFCVLGNFTISLPLLNFIKQVNLLWESNARKMPKGKMKGQLWTKEVEIWVTTSMNGTKLQYLVSKFLLVVSACTWLGRNCTQPHVLPLITPASYQGYHPLKPNCFHTYVIIILMSSFWGRCGQRWKCP